MTEALAIQLDERVREAAIQVLREHGWDGLTLERVAEASGRARSTLWRQGLGREALVGPSSARSPTTSARRCTPS